MYFNVMLTEVSPPDTAHKKHIDNNQESDNDNKEYNAGRVEQTSSQTLRCIT